MSWLITGSQKTYEGIPFQTIPESERIVGMNVEGGYFAGYISHTTDGNPTHALIVAPRATGATGSSYTLTTNLQWKTANTTTAGSDSSFDGAANTAAMVTAGIADHPAANFCVGLSIGGFSDWYLPARFELDIAYFNLKPDTTANSTSWGSNIYSVPRRNSNYTAGFPVQTLLMTFNTTLQAFVADNHWSSTDSGFAWGFGFNDGAMRNFGTSAATSRVRAFRRIAL